MHSHARTTSCARQRRRAACAGRGARRRRPCASARAPSCCARPRSAPGCWLQTIAPPADGVISEAASGAIEALLERELQRSRAVGRRLPPPLRGAPERAIATGERVRARHILFAVTPGVDVVRAAQARRSRAARRALPRRRRRDRFRALPRAHRPTAPAARRAATSAGSTRDGLRAGIRARAVRPRRGRRAAAAGAQPLRPACGRSAGARAGRGAVVRGGARRRGAWRCASRRTSRRCASTCSCWPARRRVEGVDLDAADTPLVQ